MISSRAQPQGGSIPEVDFTTDGEVSLQSGQDIHVMLAEVSATDGSGSLAYAWNAGGADDHYRALNVVTESTTGRAYYGYVPSPAANSESINLDLNNASAGMICNWAGPGNSHNTNNLVQYQALSLSNGDWTATTSNIQYVPTTSCDMAASSGVFTPAFGGPGNAISYADMSAEQKAVVDNGTLDSTAGPSAINNDLYDQSSINFTLPTAPTAPQ